jgi:hypothetical protein
MDVCPTLRSDKHSCLSNWSDRNVGPTASVGQTFLLAPHGPTGMSDYNGLGGANIPVCSMKG